MKNIFRHTTCLSLVCSLLLSSPLYADRRGDAANNAAANATTDMNAADDEGSNITADNSSDSYVSAIPSSDSQSNPDAW